MEQFKGKVALVTGATSGIGADVALALANHGMHVIAIGRRLELIEELAKNNTGTGQIHARRCDLSNEEEILQLFAWIKENFDGIHVLINNAGVYKKHFILESSTSEFSETFNVNVLASCIVLRETVQMMRERNIKGHVIIMNSILGYRIPDVPYPLFNVYPATKHALNAIAQTLQQEINFYKAPIRVTTLSPGLVKTDLIEDFTSELYEILPKLAASDVTRAVEFALAAPENVQIDNIFMSARPNYE